jgi:hypothetical protein
MIAFFDLPAAAEEQGCPRLKADADAIAVEIGVWIGQASEPASDSYRLRESIEVAIDLAEWARQQGDAIARRCGWSKEFDVLNGQAAHLEMYLRPLLRSLRETWIRERANRLTSG